MSADAIAQFAPAKINLYLHVTGRQEDGYHKLDSLVVFADVGDWVRARPAARTALKITGPHASGLDCGRENLVMRAANALSSRIGGDQIDYADEIDVVRSRFAEALSEHGISHDMNQFYESELPDLPPKPIAAE